MPTQIFQAVLVGSVLIRGIGGFLFSFIMEHNIQQTWRTRYVFSACLTILIIIVPFAYQTILFYPLLNGLNMVFFITPLLYTIFFVRKAYGDIRRKLIIVICGFLLLGLGLIFTLYSIYIHIEPLELYPYLIFTSRLIAVLGMALIFVGFYGYSFSFEFQWRESLVSLIIVDKSSNLCLYHKQFLESKQKSEDLFAEGIPSIVEVIKNFTDSLQEVDVINMGNRLLLLEHGKRIIAAFLVTKNLRQIRYVLKQICTKFEIVFWDYLIQYESYSIMTPQPEIVKPAELLIRSILKQ